MRNSQSKTILIVESDKTHHTHIDGFFKENTGIAVIIKEDIQSAIGYLESIQRASQSLPGLLLLNYKHSIKEGQQLLDELKERNLRAYIPVIALSETDDKHLVDEAYNYGVASYLVKPSAAGEWHSLFSILIQYWFSEVTLPNYSSTQRI